MGEEIENVYLYKYDMHELVNVFDEHAGEVHARQLTEDGKEQEYYHGKQLNLPLAFRSMIEEIIQIKRRLEDARVKI